MRGLLIILGFSLLFANDNNIYLEYVNKLVNYNFQLKDFDKIKPPFEIKLAIKSYESKNNKSIKRLKKTIKFDLVSILNNRAYLVVKEYIGNQLIKKYRRWVKRNDKIGDCKILAIKESKIIVKCKNKKEIISLNKKIPGLKETK